MGSDRLTPDSCPLTPGLVLPLLRQCAAAAPLPCDAREFARTQDLPWERVECCLELLAEEGILQQEPDSDRVVLTPDALRILQEPLKLEKFCAAVERELPSPGSSLSRWKAMRRTLRTPPRPIVNRLLIWANLLVFGLGILLAARHDLAFDFIWPYRPQMNGGPGFVVNPRIQEILRTTGQLERSDVLEGHWWRLLACCFVHFGILHLAMNMYALRVVGRDVEWMSGHVPYLVIYLLAALGGSCAALWTAGGVVGASGAVCGVAAAEAVWLVCNRRYLAPGPVRRQLGNLFFSGLLIGLLSMAPGVSGAAHLGGAVVGAAAAFLLHLARFGGGLTRAVAVVLLLGLPVGCLVGLKQASARWPAPNAAGTERSKPISLARLRALGDRVDHFHKNLLRPLLDQNARRRDPAAVRKVLAVMPDYVTHCRDAAETLKGAGEQRSKQSEDLRRIGENYFRTWADYLEAARRTLQEGRTWLEPARLEQEAPEARKRWRKALETLD